MKCAFCKQEIQEETNYTSINVRDWRTNSYFVLLACANCDVRVDIKSTSRYSVKRESLKLRKRIAIVPERFCKHDDFLIV